MALKTHFRLTIVISGFVAHELTSLTQRPSRISPKPTLMKRLADFLRRLIGPSTLTLIEDLHIRLLNDWITEPNRSFIHPHCVWKLAGGHPFEGIYEGPAFYEKYIEQVDSTYPSWYEVVNDVVGSRIGGIVIGEYHFRRGVNGLWHIAPFTHFYRIHDGQIVSARYYMGEVRINLQQSWQDTDGLAHFAIYSLN
jgi:hypothetical protein